MNRRERRAATRTSQATSDGIAVPRDALYRAGLVHLRAGRQPEARVCCEQALAADPNHAIPFLWLGLFAFMRNILILRSNGSLAPFGRILSRDIFRFSEKRCGAGAASKRPSRHSI